MYGFIKDAKGSEKPSQVNLTSETCPDITDVATLESTQVKIYLAYTTKHKLSQMLQKITNYFKIEI